MKYHTMNNDEIILSLCARIKETRISLSLTQQQLAERAQLGIATIKRIERGGSLNLDTLISLLRALDKLNNLNGILFESEIRNLSVSHDRDKGAGRLRIPQQAADLNKKASVRHTDETSFIAVLENTLRW